MNANLCACKEMSGMPRPSVLRTLQVMKRLRQNEQRMHLKRPTYLITRYLREVVTAEFFARKVLSEAAPGREHDDHGAEAHCAADTNDPETCRTAVVWRATSSACVVSEKDINTVRSGCRKCRHELSVHQCLRAWMGPGCTHRRDLHNREGQNIWIRETEGHNLTGSRNLSKGPRSQAVSAPSRRHIGTASAEIVA